MKKSKLMKLLDDVNQDEGNKSTFKVHDRVLLIDGMNLFLRNFAAINYINEAGVHIGGLGGFLRSLGALVNLIKPTSVYVIFDGIGSSTNRKNLHPEYKSGRNITQLTNHGIFKNIEEEHTSKVDQISRLTHYLRCLPVKTVCLDKIEADDIIAYISDIIAGKEHGKAFIVSADQDFLQLVNPNITVYRPLEREFYTEETVKNKFGVLAENFILYKTLLGDNSDKIKGIQGLGPKGIFKKFPELKEKELTLEDIFDISEAKHKEHITYSKIVINRDHLEKNYRLMNLKDPLITDDEKEFISEIIKDYPSSLDIKTFVTLYNEDGLGKSIPNVSYWLQNNFSLLNNFNQSQ